jgi:hypothetical protein
MQGQGCGISTARTFEVTDSFNAQEGVSEQVYDKDKDSDKQNDDGKDLDAEEEQGKKDISGGKDGESKVIDMLDLSGKGFGEGEDSVMSEVFGRQDVSGMDFGTGKGVDTQDVNGKDAEDGPAGKNQKKKRRRSKPPPQAAPRGPCDTIKLIDSFCDNLLAPSSTSGIALQRETWACDLLLIKERAATFVHDEGVTRHREGMAMPGAGLLDARDVDWPLDQMSIEELEAELDERDERPSDTSASRLMLEELLCAARARDNDEDVDWNGAGYGWGRCLGPQEGRLPADGGAAARAADEAMK